MFPHISRRTGRLATVTAALAFLPCASSSAAITQAHLAFTGDTSTTMDINFKEDAAVPGTTAMAYARPAGASGGASACTTAPAPSGCVALPLTRTDATGVAGTGTAYTFFGGTFTGLTPGASYDWFVTTTATPAGLAPGTFTTATGGDAPYTAATYGEVHVDDGDDVVPFGASAPGDYSVQGVVGLNQANEVVASQPTRPSFVVSSGDNMNDGSNEAMYDRLLQGSYTFPNGSQLDGTPTRSLLGSVPFMSALGDHEYKNTATAGTASPLYYASFPNPDNGPSGQENRSYSYDYNGVHWTVLEASPGNHPSSFPDYWQHELAWLDADLAAAVKRTRFQIVVMHQPPFHSKTSRVYPDYADPEFRDDVMPIFDKYGVEAVVSGHDAHNVQSYPIVSTPTQNRTDGEPTLSPEVVEPGKGTTYLEQSTTGKNYDGLLDAEPWVKWSQTEETMPAVLLFSFGQKSISVKFVRTDALDPVTHKLIPTGQPVDSFSIPQVPVPGSDTPVVPKDGKDGVDGTDGSAGAKGDAGTNGTNGANGANGAKGDTGATGAKGDTGATGATGATGKAGTFTVAAKASAASVRRGRTVTLAFALGNQTQTVFRHTTARLAVPAALRAGASRTIDVAHVDAGDAATLTVRIAVGRAATIGAHTVSLRLKIGGTTVTRTVRVRVTR